METTNMEALQFYGNIIKDPLLLANGNQLITNYLLQN